MDATKKMTCWLVFGPSGFDRMTKNYPALYKGEKTVQVQMNVPMSIFKEPSMVVNVTLKDDTAPENFTEIEASVKDALESIPDVFFTIMPIIDEAND